MENQSEVTIVDVKMPFGSMVVFMVKAAADKALMQCLVFQCAANTLFLDIRD